jgi:hypothetical protein
MKEAVNEPDPPPGSSQRRSRMCIALAAPTYVGVLAGITG